MKGAGDGVYCWLAVMIFGVFSDMPFVLTVMVNE
jgi:hypothetical protein